MKEKITIVVPVYNIEKYLNKCLDSLISQTYSDIKIICVNDGSTDASSEILEEYKKRDSRIEIVEKENGGLSSARNAGLEKVKTEFVMFCDSDDYFSPTICEKLVNSIESDKSDIAACGTNVIYFSHEEMQESDRKYYRVNYRGKNYIDDELILNTDVSVWNKIFRTEIIRKNEITFPEGINNEDFYFFNAYMSVASSISFINQKLYNYIRRENSIMSENFNKDKLSLDHLLVAEKLFTFYKRNGFLESHANLFWKQWIDSFWFSLEHSSKNHHQEIRARAKEFVKKNLEKFMPENKNILRNVKYIASNSIFLKLKRKARKTLAATYKKVNIGYRQQDVINSSIEDLQTKINDLSDRLDNIGKKDEE